MRTDDLVAALAAAPAAPAFRPARIGAAILAAAALACAAFLLAAGVRDELAAALGQPQVALKTLLPATLCAIALLLALRLTRPEARARGWARLLAAPVLLAAGLWLLAFAKTPAGLRFAASTPVAVAECLGFILLLTVPPAAVAFHLLRRGASSAPMLSGALTGLATGAAAATGYSFYCVQDAPLFFVTWYGAAILTGAGVGAWLGARVLRW